MMFKKIFFGMAALALFSACTDDYKDWAEPQTNPGVSPKTVDWTVSVAQSDAIVLDNVEGDYIKLINVSLPDGVSTESFNVKLTAEGANYPDYNITADAGGNVSVADLQKATTEMFNIEAVERTFDAVVSTFVNVKGQEGEAGIQMVSSPLVVKVVPMTPKFNPFVFFIGATDGWNNNEQNRQRLTSVSGDGIYTGFLYVADPNGWGVAFKFQKELGNWDSQLNYSSFETVEGLFCNNGDQNFEVESEGVYFFSVDLVKMTISATKIEYMGVTGDFCGWNEGTEMTWNAEDYCYELTDAGVNASGWKFRANGLTDPNWKINLGGELGNLTQDGANLSAVGNTIKLYPTRKTSDKIYCTVE